MGPLPFLLLFGRCLGAPPRSAADLRMDCRLQPRLKGRAQQITTLRTVLEMCSLCVCSALRKRMASLSFCIFPWVDGRTREGEGNIVNLSRSALSGEANFARLDCDFCSVLFVCVCVCFLEKLYFSFHSQLSLLTPAFIFHAGVKGRKCMLNSWMRPNQTKPNQQKKTAFCFG